MAVMSHRSGETDIDHRRPRRRHQLRPDQDRLAGPPDRTAKYNQLLRIEQELGKQASSTAMRCSRPRAEKSGTTSSHGRRRYK